MKLTNHGPVPVYTISGSSTARPLPEWLARKRKRSLKKDPEYANRIELLQDFEFEEASSCIRISDDGDWIVATGTYKPQIHVHYLPHLSLSFSRHTEALNQTFILLSSDYSKSLHLQADRGLEFHTPQGCHHRTRIPRYGRDLKYDDRTAEALVTSVGVDPTTQLGQVYRLNLEVGRFMKPYSVDVGGDDVNSLGAGALQGGIETGSVNAAAVAKDSHNLLAFGTSIGTVELWDSRSRNRIGLLQAPRSLAGNPLLSTSSESIRAEISALEFHHSGLTLATGSSNGLIHLFDLRSPAPLLKKDQGYAYPVHTLKFLSSPSTQSSYTSTTSPLIMSADKRIIKIWDQHTGAPWTHVEGAVDLHCVEWCRDSGMLVTANEGRQQHSFFIPQLGPAPRWCSFLDNLVEEMAEDSEDPNAYNGGTNEASGRGGEVYDNYKFVTLQDLRALDLEDRIGTALLKPYMHGYFMRQELYEEARILAQPDLWAQERQKSIQEKIDKERESRIRGSKKLVNAKVNKKLAERMLDREEKNEQRKARRALRKEEQEEAEEKAAPAAMASAVRAAAEDADNMTTTGETTVPREEQSRNGLLNDPRFASLFQDEDFEIDETSHEFRAHNPSTKQPDHEPSSRRRGLTTVEKEEAESQPRRHGNNVGSSSDADSASDSEMDSADDEQSSRPSKPKATPSNDISYHRSAKPARSQRNPDAGRVSKQKSQQGPQMRVSSSIGGNSNNNSSIARKDSSFGARVRGLNGAHPAAQRGRSRGGSGMVVGEKETTFTPATNRTGQDREEQRPRRGGRGGGRSWKDRRSASGNTLRNL